MNSSIKFETPEGKFEFSVVNCLRHNGTVSQTHYKQVIGWSSAGEKDLAKVLHENQELIPEEWKKFGLVFLEQEDEKCRTLYLVWKDQKWQVSWGWFWNAMNGDRIMWH